MPYFVNRVWLAAWSKYPIELRKRFKGGNTDFGHYKISELVCQELLCACFHRQGPTVYNICTEF